MAGPLSVPNGDVRIIRGHVQEEFICKCGNHKCDGTYDSWDNQNTHEMIPLRTHLSNRNRLVTGKTKK